MDTTHNTQHTDPEFETLVAFLFSKRTVCFPAMDWVHENKHKTIQQLWDSCTRPDWLCWWVFEAGGNCLVESLLNRIEPDKVKQQKWLIAFNTEKYQIRHLIIFQKLVINHAYGASPIGWVAITSTVLAKHLRELVPVPPPVPLLPETENK